MMTFIYRQTFCQHRCLPFKQSKRERVILLMLAYEKWEAAQCSVLRYATPSHLSSTDKPCNRNGPTSTVSRWGRGGKVRSYREKGRKEVTERRGRKAWWGENIWERKADKKQPIERKCWRKRGRKKVIEWETQKCESVIKRCDYGGQERGENFILVRESLDPPVDWHFLFL